MIFISVLGKNILLF